MGVFFFKHKSKGYQYSSENGMKVDFCLSTLKIGKIVYENERE